MEAEEGKTLLAILLEKTGIFNPLAKSIQEKIVGVEKMTSYNAELNSVKVLCMCNCIIPSPRELNTVGGKG